MIFYAIRHKTQGYLPSAPKGHTHNEPSLLKPPRLFTKAQYAKNALTLYLQGKWEGKQTYSGTDNQPEDFIFAPIPCGRKAADYSIVKVAIIPCEDAAFYLKGTK